MSDYKFAFKAACADLGAVSTLLGFESYPGIDPILKAITNLIVADRPAPEATPESAEPVAWTADALYPAIEPQPDGEQQREPLRRAVKAVVAMLNNGEYAEHWADAEAPGDADVADLEAAITELVNETHEASEQQAARGLSDGVLQALRDLTNAYGILDGCLDESGNANAHAEHLLAKAIKNARAILSAKGDGHE